MENVLILLLCCAYVCNDQQATASETSENTNNIARIVEDSYDVSRTFDENFYSILGIICPQSVYCFGNDTSTTHANGTVFQNILNDNIHVSTNTTSTNQSYLTSEARASLKANAHKIQGCCTPCSCQDDCTERSNCCPSMEPAPQQADAIKPERSVTQECVYASIKAYLERYTQFSKAEVGGHSYYMVTDCYAENVTEELVTKCRRPNPEFPDEVRPVYSSSSGRNYKSRFCAKCNNDTQVTPWLAEIAFDRDFSLTGYLRMPSTPAELYKGIIRTQRLIQLIYNPPANMYLQTKKHECVMSNPITTSSDKVCKEAQDSDRIQFSQRACEAHQMKYETSTRTYNNVFCLLCGHRDNLECQVREKSMFNSYTALVDLSSIQPGSHTETTGNTDTPCNEVEYFDREKKICRDLKCPPGEAFADDKCVAFLHNIKDMRMKIYLEIATEEPRETATESFKDQLEEKATTFERKLNRFLTVTWDITKPTQSLAFLETSSSDSSHMKLHYVTLITFEGMTDVRVIMEKMFNALRIGVSARILDVPMKITLGRIFEINRNTTVTNDNLASLFDDADTMIEPLGSVTADITERSHAYKIAQELTKLAFCKRVVLEEDEIELLKNNSSAVGISQLYLGYVFYDKDGSMCLDDFERAFLPLASEAISWRFDAHVIYLVCLLIYI